MRASPDRLNTVNSAATDSISTGDRIELTVGSVAHGGVFVGKLDDGRVVFVADALPGERVVARITQVHKRFARAVTETVLAPSEHRQAHVWDAASVERDPQERAGGAEFGHMLPSVARELKRQVLADALTRFGGIAPGELDSLEVLAIPGDDERRGTGWRTRVTLHVDSEGNVGPFAARSHRVVRVDSLPLAFADIEEAALQQIARGAAGPARMDFVAPADLEVRMRTVPDGKKPRAGATIRERVGNREFKLAQHGFWQVHRQAAATLYRAVTEALVPELLDASARHLDLYGGVGLLGAALAETVGDRANLVSVEADAVATGFAETNLREWVGAAAHTVRVDRYLRELLRTAGDRERAEFARGTVVLDPPRAGAGADVVHALGALAPAQLVYVACDPVALARDTGSLREQGYELRRVRAFDLFPNTHHLEAVASFVRA